MNPTIPLGYVPSKEQVEEVDKLLKETYQKIQNGEPCSEPTEVLKKLNPEFINKDGTINIVNVVNTQRGKNGHA